MFTYVLEGNIIDWFQGSMTLKELENSIRKLETGEFGMWSKENVKAEIDKVNALSKQSISIIKKVSGEEPHTVNFFTIPNFDSFSMEYCIVAKIENNGTTYVFSNNKKFLESISDNDWEINSL